MKKTLLLLSSLILCAFSSNAQVIPIDNGVFGQNANLTDTVGININAGGKLNNYWNRALPGQNYVKDSRVYFMRYGGIQVENECLIDGAIGSNSDLDKTLHDYIRKATIMNADGITPMLTLPLKFVGTMNSFGAVAAQAAILVKNVNDSLKARNIPVVKYWVYSNEPEDSGFHLYDDSTAAKTIHDYIVAFYNAITPVWNANASSWGVTAADLKFVGPELYNYDNYNHGTGKVNRLIEQLTGQYNQLAGATNAHDIRPYISVFSWHLYSFNSEADSTVGIPKPTRANVVNSLKLGAPKVGGGTSNPFLTDVNQIKGWLPPTIDVAITEANICHKNDINPGDGYNVTDDGITGNGANSFIGGQFWAEMMSYSMEGKVKFLNFWSGLEGCNGGAGCTDPLYKTNVGYLNSDPSKFGGLGGKKPSYYHFKMLSDNFHGNFHRGNYFHNAANPSPTFTNGNGIKTFASVEPAGIKIMILNQNDSAYKFRINFNGSTVVGADTIRLQFPNISSDPNISGTIQSNHLYYPTATDTAYKKIAGRSTVLLTFDCNGIFQSRQDYSEADAIGNNPPHYTIIGNTPVDPSMLAAENLINCGHPGIGGTINSNTTYSNTTVYVSNDILITGGSELKFVNCLVVVAQGKKIKANPNCGIVLDKTIMVGWGGNTWKGLELNGNYHAGERLKIDNSYIFNASNPVYADKVGDMHIKKSVFANGITAVELNRSAAFSITENTFVGYNEGIKTTNTKPNFVSEIKDNRMIELETAIKFAGGDQHNMLDVFCNDLLYRQKGIESISTDLKIQGSTSMSAGNRFIKITPGAPLDYINHSGTATSYYFGPSETAQFSLPMISNIPVIMAAADRTCKQPFLSVCAPWTIGIEENVKTTPTFLIYPNPSTGAFTINFSKLEKGNWNLTVYDVMGRLISTQKVDSNSESTTLQIVSKGLYFVSLQSGNNRITQKVIVE